MNEQQRREIYFHSIKDDVCIVMRKGCNKQYTLRIEYKIGATTFGETLLRMHKRDHKRFYAVMRDCEKLLADLLAALEASKVPAPEPARPTQIRVETNRVDLKPEDYQPVDIDLLETADEIIARTNEPIERANLECARIAQEMQLLFSRPPKSPPKSELPLMLLPASLPVATATIAK